MTYFTYALILALLLSVDDFGCDRGTTMSDKTCETRMAACKTCFDLSCSCKLLAPLEIKTAREKPKPEQKASEKKNG